MADTVLPRYKVDAAGELVPDLRAEAAIVYNPETREVLWEENSQEQRSIASITKVMTAAVFLEDNPNLSETVEIVSPDVFRASTTYLRRRDRLTTGDLLHLLLVASDNAAARALARVSRHGSEGFVQRMNEKAVELELADTRYADPSGLLADNVSSAFDMARLITIASEDSRIASAMQVSAYTAHTQNRDISVRNTSRLLVDRMGLQVKAAKTGFISRSGYCLATLLRLPQSDQEVAVVVLGARSNAGRFLETRNLIDWFAAKTAAVFAAAAPVAPAPVGSIPALLLP
jgi:D-alanyl-D-alanine endopeptidase (penicillin-binding protein 7)